MGLRRVGSLSLLIVAVCALPARAQTNTCPPGSADLKQVSEISSSGTVELELAIGPQCSESRLAYFSPDSWTYRSNEAWTESVKCAVGPQRFYVVGPQGLVDELFITPPADGTATIESFAGFDQNGSWVKISWNGHYADNFFLPSAICPSRSCPSLPADYGAGPVVSRPSRSARLLRWSSSS